MNPTCQTESEGPIPFGCYSVYPGLCSSKVQPFCKDQSPLLHQIPLIAPLTSCGTQDRAPFVSAPWILKHGICLATHSCIKMKLLRTLHSDHKTDMPHLISDFNNSVMSLRKIVLLLARCKFGTQEMIGKSWVELVSAFIKEMKVQRCFWVYTQKLRSNKTKSEHRVRPSGLNPGFFPLLGLPLRACRAFTHSHTPKHTHNCMQLTS